MAWSHIDTVAMPQWFSAGKGSVYSLDWTTGMDYWTGLLDSPLTPNTNLNEHYSVVPL